MVKNTIGGKRGKMMANKRVGNGGEKKLRLSMNDDEKYVCVSKTFGGGMFKVIDNDGNEYNAILRGKMKGPNKRHNFVSLFSILLVGIRSDLSDSSICDILFVFDDHDILSLSLLPLNLGNLLSFHQNHSFQIGKGGGSSNSNDIFLTTNDDNHLNKDSNLNSKIITGIEDIDLNLNLNLDLDFNDI